MFPSFERVRGPTNSLSIGRGQGLAACIPTRASSAGLACWQRSHLHTYSKISARMRGHQKLVAIFRKVFLPRQHRVMEILEQHTFERGRNHRPTPLRLLRMETHVPAYLERINTSRIHPQSIPKIYTIGILPLVLAKRRINQR
jgi:hypothetical protein